MKQFKFYSIIVLIIIILILAFENIAYPVLFLFFFSDLNTPITVPMLIAAVLGTSLGWLSRSYSQDLKDEKNEEELDSEEVPTTLESTEASESTEAPAQPSDSLSETSVEEKPKVEDNEVMED